MYTKRIKDIYDDITNSNMTDSNQIQHQFDKFRGGGIKSRKGLMRNRERGWGRKKKEK